MLTREEYNAQFEEYQREMHHFRVKAQEEVRLKKEVEETDGKEKNRSEGQKSQQLSTEEQRQRAEAKAKRRELHQQQFEAAVLTNLTLKLLLRSFFRV